MDKNRLINIIKSLVTKAMAVKAMLVWNKKILDKVRILTYLLKITCSITNKTKTYSVINKTITYSLILQTPLLQPPNPINPLT